MRDTEQVNNDLLAGISKQFTEKIEEHVKKLDIPEPVKWIENNFYIPETRKDPKLNGKFRLQEYQKDVLREALSRDEKGNYRYSIIVWSDIKKSAKCVTAETEILLADRRLVAAGCISSGDYVLEIGRAHV